MNDLIWRVQSSKTSGVPLYYQGLIFHSQAASLLLPPLKLLLAVSAWLIILSSIWHEGNIKWFEVQKVWECRVFDGANTTLWPLWSRLVAAPRTVWTRQIRAKFRNFSWLKSCQNKKLIVTKWPTITSYLTF